MRRTTIVFIIFIVVVGGIIGLLQFINTQPPLEITVAVDPLAEDWVRAAAQQFNETNTIVNGTSRIHVNVQSVSDLRVWDNRSGWTSSDHPAAWVPSSSSSVSYAPATLPFAISQSSLARTPLVWGGFNSRVNIITEDGATVLGWDVIANAAEIASWQALGGENSWNFIKLAYNRPNNSMAGIGVILSGAGHLFETITPDRSQLSSNEFEQWFQPVADSVPNFQTLGANPAATMATRGVSTVELALLPESQWLMQLSDLVKLEPLTFAYPTYQFILDFPYTIWEDIGNGNSIEQQAAQAFGDYLMRTEAQSLTVDFGLRPANQEPDETATVFTNGVQYGILLEPDYDQIVEAPEKNVLESVLNQFG